MLKNIAVFCGSHFAKSPRYLEAAESLGRLLAQQGRTLVYGGSGWGYMGAVKQAAQSQQGRVVGVLPTLFSADAKTSSMPIDELVMVESMADRKRYMVDTCDAFIAIPGGIGTLDELTEVLVADQLGMVCKPVGLLNVDGFFDHFVAQLHFMHDQGLVNDALMNFLIVDSDPESLLQRMDSFVGFQDAEIKSKLR